MKKILFAYALLMLLCCLAPRSLTYHCAPRDATYHIYCAATSAPDAVSIGNGYIVTTNTEQYARNLSLCDGVEGVSVRVRGVSPDKLIEQLRVKVLFEQTIGNEVNLYGYSPMIKGGVYVQGVRVNVQIYSNDDVTHIGSPLILGSY